MMPVIRISDDTYGMLQQLGRAFVDTPDTVIARLAKAELQRTGGGAAVADERDANALQLDPQHPDA